MHRLLKLSALDHPNMDEYLYKQQLAQQLQKDFQSSHFAQLPAQKQLNVKANVAYLLGGDAFGGACFFCLMVELC